MGFQLISEPLVALDIASATPCCPDYLWGHSTRRDDSQLCTPMIQSPYLTQARTIKESIYIRVNNPTLNKNIGKLNLHHIWDRVLLNTPVLKINGHVQSTPHWACSVPQPNTTMHIFTGSMEHAQTTPWSEHAHRTS